MKECYIDKCGQKRRLRISAGDVVLCETENGILPYLVTVNECDETLFGLTCLLCSRPVAATNFSKKDLQLLLYSMSPYGVVKREQLRSYFAEFCQGKTISNCI